MHSDGSMMWYVIAFDSPLAITRKPSPLADLCELSQTLLDPYIPSGNSQSYAKDPWVFGLT